MAERDSQGGKAAWGSAALALGLLLACVVGLAWSSLVGSPAPAGASEDPSTISSPISTTRTSPSTEPPTTTKSTTPQTTAVSRTTVTASTAPAPTAPPVSQPAGPYTSYTYVTSTSTSTSTTSTTLAGIESQVSAPVATVPLATKASNGHVSPVLPWLSGGGMAAALLIVAGRLFVTRAGGSDRSPLDGT